MHIEIPHICINISSPFKFSLLHMILKTTLAYLWYYKFRETKELCLKEITEIQQDIYRHFKIDIKTTNFKRPTIIS